MSVKFRPRIATLAWPTAFASPMVLRMSCKEERLDAIGERMPEGRQKGGEGTDINSCTS